MTEPTDAELHALLPTKLLERDKPPKVQVWLTQKDALAFARAVLSKFGAPPAVAGEPVAEFDQQRGRLVILDGAPMFKHRQKVYTAPQPTQAQAGAITPPPIECNTEELKKAYAFGWWSALEKQRETAQAVAVPLTREQVKAILTECGYDGASAQHRADFINGLRHGEAAHGIKGGQHG